MSIVIAILIFSFIIIFHETGHFLLARANGITVKEFSLGLGPRICGFTGKSGTVFCLKALPFGGSCMMLGEEEGAEVGEGSFGSKGPWQRISVIAAGPIFNFILAFVFSLIIVGAYGYDEPVVSGVIDGYPAQSAGITAGDRIEKINGRSIHIFRDINAYLTFQNADRLTVVYEHNGTEKTVEITPETDENGNRLLGVRGGNFTHGGVMQTLKYSAYEVGYWIRVTYQSLGALVTGRIGMDSLSGPVGIVSYIGDTYQETAKVSAAAVFSSMMNIAILLSATLGVMNLLPLPALDGGRLVFLVLEVIRGKRIDPEKEGRVHLIGMLLLLALMVFVMFHDIINLFG